MSAVMDPGRPAVPRLLIAGVSSGVGKTTVTLGLLRALRRKGLEVAAFKCGPDYLDPTYHARASGGRCHNLDGWMMGRDAVLRTFARAAAGADLAIIEGVMGLFDGASPTSERGSSAEIAKWLGAPVILVMDASGMARSAAALAHGFATFDPALHLAGVVCNRVGSAGHLDLLRQATGDTRWVGGLPREPQLSLPERHLGLCTAEPNVVPDDLFEAWADRVDSWLEPDALMAIARHVPPLPHPPARPPAQTRRCRIGVAWDAAFHFYYEDNLQLLETMGAELVRFSPIRDARPPAVDGLYFGGGYPELHAAALAENAAMRLALADMGAAGTPIYAECGGLMYLTRGIIDTRGDRYAMVGLLDAEARCTTRLRALGYVEVQTTATSLLGDAGLEFRGHQFRYSELEHVAESLHRVYRVQPRRGGEAQLEGLARDNVLASYVHAHWASCPAAAEGFVAACEHQAQRGR